MQFNYAYSGNSAIDNSANRTALSFAPDLTREPTFFRGELRKGVAFREAISALHDVVISDKINIQKNLRKPVKNECQFNFKKNLGHYRNLEQKTLCVKFIAIVKSD